MNHFTGLYVIFILHFVQCFQVSFWDICDVHLNLSHKSQDKKDYGDYKKDSTISLIKSAFQFMKATHPTPDFILVNGDNVYHGNENFEKILNTTKDALRNEFPSTIILPSLGNHDVMPRNILGESSNWCERLYDFWSTFLSTLDKTEISSFKTGCFYSRNISSTNGSVIVITLNTLLWYNRNDDTKGVSDPLGQFSWLEKKLQGAKDSKTKVFLTGHIPPGASEFSTQLIIHLQPAFNERFLKLLQRYADIIEAGFFAHQHTDAFKIVYSVDEKPVIPIFQSPSISPYYLSKLGSVNPSVRFYQWNEQKYTSYFQYHTTLSPNIKGLLNWSLEYTSSSLLKSLSAEHLEDFVTDLAKNNSKYFNKFFTYHLSGRPHDDESCAAESLCRRRFVCVMKNIDYVKLDECLSNDRNQPERIIIIVLPLVFGTVLIFIIVAVLIYFLYYKKKNSRNVIN